MMIGAHQHKIIEDVVPTAAKPLDVMTFTERLAVLVDWVPPADLTVAVV
jgi:hypothetical protein